MNLENRKTILLVEDEIIIAAAHSSLLRANSYEVISVMSGEEAIEIIKSNKGIDLVLMDIDLGIGIDGTETAKQILSLKEIPIVFLTSHSEKELVERVRNITRYGYIIKNSGNFVLLSSIEMAFELFYAHKKTTEKEELFQLIAENTLDLIGLHKLDGTYIYLSPSVERILGYKEEELIGVNPYTLFHPDDAEKIRNDSHTKVLSGQDGLAVTYRIRHKNGSYVWLETISKSIWNKEKTEIIQLQTVSRNITQRMFDYFRSKELEHELKVSEERYRMMVESSTEATYVHREGKFVYANAAGLKLVGAKSFLEIQNKNIIDFVHPDFAGKVRERLNILYNDRKEVPSMEERFFRLDGTPFDAQISAFPISFNGLPAVQVIARDITESKHQEKLIQEKEERVRLALSAGNQGLFDLNLLTGMAVVNDSYAQMLGFELDELTESISTWRERLHPDDRDAAYKIFQEYVNGLRDDYKVEFRQKTKSGSWKWILSHGKIVERDKKNNPIRMLGTHTDITERKQFELVQVARNNVLDKVMAKKSINEILEEIIKEIELIYPEIKASILILDSLTGRLKMGAAPSLPDFYNEAIDNLLPGPAVGSCGTAVYLGRQVIVEDISVHPYWKDFRDLALKAGLKACWSEPFKDDSGKILGTFAAYYSEARIPKKSEIDIVFEFSRITGIAVQSNKNEMERMKAEEEVKALLIEKEILLKEVHHRIKNNMASISSLLSLQADYVDDPQTVKILGEAQNRILSMMLIYDKLYRSTDYKNISIQDYLYDLIDQILFSFSDNEKIKVEKKIDDFVLNSKSLFSIGIIINELITNSFKYAFPHGMEGNILIEVKQLSGDKISLTVSDDGVGLPDGFTISESRGFGLNLIKMLTQKKGNSFEITKDKGTSFKIVIDV